MTHNCISSHTHQSLVESFRPPGVDWKSESLALSCGRDLEHQGKTYTGSQRTCKPNTRRPGGESRTSSRGVVPAEAEPGEPLWLSKSPSRVGFNPDLAWFLAPRGGLVYKRARSTRLEALEVPPRSVEHACRSLVQQNPHVRRRLLTHYQHRETSNVWKREATFQ